jgi:hypothetical protein
MGASRPEGHPPGAVQPLICLEFGLQNKGSDPTPTIQMDLVASEIHLPKTAACGPESGKAWAAVTATRKPVNVNCLRSFGVQEEYQNFRPHVAAFPFADDSYLHTLHQESRHRVLPLRLPPSSRSTIFLQCLDVDSAVIPQDCSFLNGFSFWSTCTSCQPKLQSQDSLLFFRQTQTKLVVMFEASIDLKPL